MRKHSPVSYACWQALQKQTLDRWRKKNLKLERQKSRETNYLPLLLKFSQSLAKKSEILEVGCGPICLSQAIPTGKKTYLDPLLDDYRRLFPGELPEGTYIASSAEKIAKPNHSYDLIICLNTLSHTLNPELVLNEIERLLKPHGKLLLGIRTHSLWRAKLHYWKARWLPPLFLGGCPYYYSHNGIKRTLARHFTIADDIVTSRIWIPLFRSEERLFVCTSLTGRRAGTSPDKEK